MIISSLMLVAACAANESDTPTLQSGNSLPASSAVIHLTQQLANELVRQNDQLTPKQPLLVATPVLLDNLKTTNALGLQIQQGLIAAMHDHQFNLVDINVGENLRVTEQGELILTRDWRQLPTDLPVEHVLASTMSLNPNGVVINSRIVNVTNNRVVSVAGASVGQSELADYLSLSEKVTSQGGVLFRYSAEGQADVQIKGVNQ
ncbi:FlgO family outer membrane protein [Shewanella marisflavi]|uniref:FlgO family outer membrane protein n=1 Tax=Shewanella marisflavi TaxID=260364 RepID=UPI0028158BF3|nr:FlgO family outer membrane protein [Shewanella marisflavi]